MSWPTEEDLPRCGAKEAAQLALIVVLLVGASGAVGYLKGTRAGLSKAIQAQAMADEAKGRADAERTRATGFDQAAQAAETRTRTADARAAALAREVARLRTAGPLSDPAPSAGDPFSDPHPAPVDLAPLVAKQDELIQAQQVQIAARDEQIKGLAQARDAWRAAHDERQQEAVQLRAALKAQEGLAAGNLWRGRIQGFAVGAALGFAGGVAR